MKLRRVGFMMKEVGFKPGVKERWSYTIRCSRLTRLKVRARIHDKVVNQKRKKLSLIHI